MTTGESTSGDSRLVLSYLALRRSLGVLGVALPVILPIGVFVLGDEQAWQPSISDYYGTVMRGVFVGVLVAIGVFLVSYVGYEPDDTKRPYEPSDNTAGNLAGVFAVGVALFPTTSDIFFVQAVHFVSAVLLFGMFAFFSLRLFTKGVAYPTDEKKMRNRIYSASGWVILGCIVAIAVHLALLTDTVIDDLNPIFWLEALALWAFGWAWFVKGEGMRRLNDVPT